MSRLITDLIPPMQVLFHQFRMGCDEAGLAFVVTRTLATLAEQTAYYAKGRQPLEEVNKLMRLAGLGAITAKENIVVTKTMNSRHLGMKHDHLLVKTNPEWEGKSLAFDIALLREDGKTPHWNTKISVDEDDIPDYLEAAHIGESVGLLSGGLWKGNFKDWPHFEFDVANYGHKN